MSALCIVTVQLLLRARKNSNACSTERHIVRNANASTRASCSLPSKPPPRQAAARTLGVHRETLGRWRACYAEGGLPALLDVYVPAGKPPLLPAPVLADLEPPLQQPQGFASYKDMCAWLLETHAMSLSPNTRQKFVRRFGARLKVARPRQLKKTPAR